MIKTLIVDDETSGRKVLSELIRLKHPEIELLAAVGNIEEAIAAIDMYRPELVFLDIKMGNRSGFEVLNKTQFNNFHVIFVTAHDEFGIQAIKVSALDYLLKPVSIRELAVAIQKFKDQRLTETPMPDIHQLADVLMSSVAASPKKITLLTKDGYELIPPDDIHYLVADHNYTRVYLKGGTQRLVTRNLGSFEDQLNSPPFMRIHKSHMVNLDQANTYIPGNGGFLVMTDGRRFEVSRRRKGELLERLDLQNL